MKTVVFSTLFVLFFGLCVAGAAADGAFDDVVHVVTDVLR